MGRATSGVTGMRFREDDELLTMEVVRPGASVFTLTDGGYAKRTSVQEWTAKGRGGLGVQAARISSDRGSLVGAVIVDDDDEVLAITLAGGVIRSPVQDVPVKGRVTMGVRFMDLSDGDSVTGVARASAAQVAVEEEPATVALGAPAAPPPESEIMEVTDVRPASTPEGPAGADEDR
jgi:DNA gyrase subunit A